MACNLCNHIYSLKMYKLKYNLLKHPNFKLVCNSNETYYLSTKRSLILCKLAKTSSVHETVAIICYRCHIMVFYLCDRIYSLKNYILGYNLLKHINFKLVCNSNKICYFSTKLSFIYYKLAKINSIHDTTYKQHVFLLYQTTFSCYNFIFQPYPVHLARHITIIMKISHYMYVPVVEQSYDCKNIYIKMQVCLSSFLLGYAGYQYEATLIQALIRCLLLHLLFCYKPRGKTIVNSATYLQKLQDIVPSNSVYDLSLIQIYLLSVLPIPKISVTYLANLILTEMYNYLIHTDILVPSAYLLNAYTVSCVLGNLHLKFKFGHSCCFFSSLLYVPHILVNTHPRTNHHTQCTMIELTYLRLSTTNFPCL